MTRGVTRVAVPAFVQGRDRRGPIGVGAEVAFRTPVLPGEAPRQGRIVAYGNAQFANNFFIEFLGNKDLFANSVAWLVRDPEGVGASRPQASCPASTSSSCRRRTAQRLFWTSAVGLPAAFAAGRHRRSPCAGGGAC